MRVTRLLALLLGAVALLGVASAQQVEPAEDAVASDVIELEQDTSDTGGCEFDEIQLASDGTIEQRSLEMGERVTPNTTLNGTVEIDEYHFYHLCILRHEHEHQINLNLTQFSGDASLFLSSAEKYPRRGHSSWISQHPGHDFVKLYTYLDGFPRRSDRQNRSISLHIGVLGVDALTSYNLTVSVLDLPITEDIAARETYYTQRHRHPAHDAAAATTSRRLRG